MRFGSKEYLKRYVGFLVKQYALANNPAEVCDYFPINVHLDISDDCNLRCIHCHDHRIVKRYGNIDWGTFKNAITQIKDIGSAVTFGNKGEPFLHPDAPRMIKYAKKAGLFVNIITNGTLFNDHIAKALVEAKVDRLVISLDSSSPDVYEKSRVGAKYKKTFLGLMQLLKANYEKKSPMFVYISCVAHKIVLKSLEKSRKYFLRLPIDSFFISPLHSQFGMTKIEKETMFVSKCKGKVKAKDHPICMNGFNRMFIYPNGNVGLCDNEILGLYTVGNVNRGKLRDMWNNKAARLYRKALIERDYSLIEKNGKLCSVCDFKWIQNTENCTADIINVLSNEIAENDEFLKDLSKRHAGEKYNFVLNEIKRLKR